MKTVLQIWGFPVLMAVLLTFGLLAALLGVGLWHGASWISTAIPVMIGLRHWLKR